MATTYFFDDTVIHKRDVPISTDLIPLLLPPETPFSATEFVFQSSDAIETLAAVKAAGGRPILLSFASAGRPDYESDIALRSDLQFLLNPALYPMGPYDNILVPRVKFTKGPKEDGYPPIVPGRKIDCILMPTARDTVAAIRGGLLTASLSWYDAVGVCILGGVHITQEEMEGVGKEFDGRFQKIVFVSPQ
jgi:hypothetical protein